MARITVCSDDGHICGELTDDTESIGHLGDRETANTLVAVIHALVNRARFIDARDLGGRLIERRMNDRG
jgi:hypothetical protein